MNQDISSLNKAFESRIRLGIMAILIVSDSVEFSELRDKLKLTDGNLASHIGALERSKFIEVTKQFIGKKPNTSYKISDLGRKAFNDHLDALENLIKLRK
jgi:DNA-binding MarR family transcriptional regulator